jgi:hypothetical protein
MAEPSNLEKMVGESDLDYAARLKRVAEEQHEQVAVIRRETDRAMDAAERQVKLAYVFAGLMLILGLVMGYAGFRWTFEAPKMASVEAKACTSVPDTEAAKAIAKLTEQCIAKLPDALPYQPTAPAPVAPARSSSKKHDTQGGHPKKDATGGIDPGYEICRLRSDGTARLKSNPSKVLPHGYVIAVDLKDPESPNAVIVEKQTTEDCNAWRTRVTLLMVDKTGGGVAKRT